VATTPHFYERKDLLRRKERNKQDVECGVSWQQMNVLELLDGIRVDQAPAWAAPRTIRIFLASSAELKDDRDAFDLYFRRQNDQLKDKGNYLEIIRWEYFLDAMSETRLQDEYNSEVASCDVFVALFFTKSGKFTEEEFNVAYNRFKSSGRPLIYTYFKDAEIKTGSARREDLQSPYGPSRTNSRPLGTFRQPTTMSMACSSTSATNSTKSPTAFRPPSPTADPDRPTAPPRGPSGTRTAERFRRAHGRVRIPSERAPDHRRHTEMLLEDVHVAEAFDAGHRRRRPEHFRRALREPAHQRPLQLLIR
jgi:hypothetical protein